MKSAPQLNSPYGGDLVSLLVGGDERLALLEDSVALESLTLSPRALCDLELLSVGGFSPLTSFMNKKDYESVLKRMRLNNGMLFPMPVTLSVNQKYKLGQKLALRDGYSNLLAVMVVEDIYVWSPEKYMQMVFGKFDAAHPTAKEVLEWGKYNISGTLKVIATPTHLDFKGLRLTPNEVRMKLEDLGNSTVVAFQTRNPLHRAHEELTKLAATESGGTLLLHPSVGMTKTGDVDYITRVRCYQALLDNYYDNKSTLLSLLPLAMRMGGPREALWHAIIRKNYGASHFIVGRDHAGPGKDSNGNPFHDPYDAQVLVKQHESEIGIKILTYNEMVYIPGKEEYAESHTISPDVQTRSLSGTQVREEYLAEGRSLPEWFTRPEVASILSESYPSKQKQGFCLWFTGLSGSGKSTIAQAVEARLHEVGKNTTMLDGDIVRRSLSKGLGFSKADRETNISRVGFVASEIVHHGGIAICALISPYMASRELVRSLFSDGKFIEIYVSTPLHVCEQRDPKGHYAKTHHGKLINFTGVDDEYEPPKKPEITVDTEILSIEESVETIIDHLHRVGFLEQK